MPHEMADATVDEVREGTQHDGEDDARFTLDMFYIAAGTEADPKYGLRVNVPLSTSD